MTDVVRVTSAVYDVIANAYDEQTRVPSPELDDLREVFRSLVRGPVADLGCGPGRDLQRLDDVVGMDRSDGMLALARTRGRVVRGDLRRPPFLDLAGVWSNASLLHVPREDVPATLAAWHECLRPGGVLGLSTSLGDEEGWEKMPYGIPHDHRGPDERWFVHHPEEVLLGALRDAGFTVARASRRTTNRHWLMVLAAA
jgi:SAM-dependent methyltransferase